MMNDPYGSRQAPIVGAGLCARCVHGRIITNDRGSAFHLCRLSLTDPRFARYPQLPVVACPGFSAAGSGSPPTGAPGC